MENSKLNLSVSPHIKSPRTTASIMLDVLIALLPTTLAGCVIFGAKALLVVLAGMASAVLSEYIYCLITKKENTIFDFSAAVTGLLLALNVPANTPIWQIALGSAFAVIFVKCIFGGIGKNFANPAIVGRIFMLIAFAELARPAFPTWDTVAGATPLPELAAGKELSLLDLFLGNCGGAIGEVCAAALIAGGIYLVIRKVIKPYAPLAFIVTVYLGSLIYEGFDFGGALAWVLSGGLLLGAIFMATDYVTTPLTSSGKLVFGIGCGLITLLIRFFGNYPEGVSFAILIMNILTPYIDRICSTRPFGGARHG